MTLQAVVFSILIALTATVAVAIGLCRMVGGREVQELQDELNGYRMAAIRCPLCGRPQTMGGHVCTPLPPLPPPQPQRMIEATYLKASQ